MGLTTLTLAASLGLKDMFVQVIKRTRKTKWNYGPVHCYSIRTDEIDSDPHVDRITALQCIVQHGQKDLLSVRARTSPLFVCCKIDVGCCVALAQQKKGVYALPFALSTGGHCEQDCAGEMGLASVLHVFAVGARLPDHNGLLHDPHSVRPLSPDNSAHSPSHFEHAGCLCSVATALAGPGGRVVRPESSGA